jgi:phosphatidyl-myo-inositol dimannoside synthase
LIEKIWSRFDERQNISLKGSIRRSVLVSRSWRWDSALAVGDEALRTAFSKSEATLPSIANREQGALRVLALVTDAFGGHGGIAQYNQDFLGSLATCERIQEIIVLPRFCSSPNGKLPLRVQQLSPVQDRIAYSLNAMGAALAYRRVDIILCGHVFMAPLAASLARFFRTRLWVLAYGLEAWKRPSPLHQRSLEYAELVVSISRYTRARLLEWVAIDPARVKILPPTVRSRFFPGPKPSYLLDRYQLHGKKVILTVSRLTRSDSYKGHDRVMGALPSVLSRFPGAVYLVVGDGDDRPRLETSASELGIRKGVMFAGGIDADELPDHFRLADVFIMPSTGEGFGIVFLEALASGIEVISGNRDGSVDPLADGALGATVDPDNKEELVAAVCNALSNPRARVGCAGRFDERAFSEHLRALVGWSSAAFALDGR